MVAAIRRLIDQTGQMESWTGLAGVLAGAAIALLGQYFGKRLERRQARGALFLEQCAQVIALQEDYRGRLWEERRLGAEHSVAGWDLREYRLVDARIRLLTTDVAVIGSLDQLSGIGIELGRAWRTSRTDSEELQRAWVAHRAELDHFIKVAGVLVRAELRVR